MGKKLVITMEGNVDLFMIANAASKVRLQNNSSRSISHMRLKFCLMDWAESMKNHAEMEKKMTTPILPPLRKKNEKISLPGVSGNCERWLPLCTMK